MGTVKLTICAIFLATLIIFTQPRSVLLDQRPTADWIQERTVWVKREDGGWGSGAFIDDKGTVVTAAHVVRNAIDIKIITFKGNSAVITDVTIMMNKDVAYLNTDLEGTAYFEVGEFTFINVGDEVYVCGCPLYEELTFTVTRGIVSNLARHYSERAWSNLFQIDAATYPGNSGGPVIWQGKLIGIVVGGYWEGDNLTLCSRI